MRQRVPANVLLLIGVFAWLDADRSSATVFTWNGSISTDWFNSTNWIPTGVPTSTDTVNFANGTTINLTSPVTVAGSFNWISGTLSGKAVTIASGGAMNISGSATLDNILTNAGTVNLSSNAAVYIYNNNSSVLGGVYNLATGLWDIQTNAPMYSGGYGFEFFNNAGTFRKSGGAGYATIYVPFTNNGLLTNLMGIVSFNGGGALTGTYGTAAGATTYFASGNFTMGTPPVITGSGLCEFQGTTLALTQTVPSNLVLGGGDVVLGAAFQGGTVTNLTLSGATLASTNKVTGTLNAVSGTIAGSLTVASGGMVNIIGSLTLNNVLTNAGTVNLTSNALVYVYNNNSSDLGGVYNLAGGTWDFQTNATIYSGNYGFEFFNNAGTFRKSGGSSYSTVYVPFTNSGTLDVLIGILSYSSSFTTTGGTLAFGASSLANYGQINVTGNVALNGTASVSWLGGFMPAVGNSFALLSYGSHSGTFATITLPSGSAATPTYGATIFSLTITNATTQTNAPVFLNIKLISSNTVVVSWPSSATNYTLQTNASLSPATWGNVTSGISTVSTNDVLTNTVNGKSDFFRLRSP